MNHENRVVVVLLASLLTLVISYSLYVGILTYLWLGWNTFLAVLPWVFSNVAFRFHQRGRGHLTLMFGLAWLLFFPNAPYVVTDLAYMPYFDEHLWWYNQVVLVGIATTGLILGYYSWRLIGAILRCRFSPRTVLLSQIMFLYLAAFGIYLGRFSRWNSLDVLSKPSALLFNIADRFLNPQIHPRTWVFTLLFGTALLLGAWMVGGLKETNDQQCPAKYFAGH